MDIINYSKVKKLEEKVNTNKAEVATFKEDYATQAEFPVKNEVVNGDTERIYATGTTNSTVIQEFTTPLPISKYMLVYTITQTGTLNTRNTPQIGYSDLTVITESGLTNYNVATGKKAWIFDATKTISKVQWWGHTLDVSTKINYINLIDLTKTFGAGKEPTALEMDTILAKFPNSWFNGTVNLKTLREAYSELKAEKANKVQEAWITPTLTSGWTAVYPVQYYKDQFGIVHIKGCVSNPSATLPNACFTLPVGYRSTQTMGFATQTNNAATSILYLNAGALVVAGTAKSGIYLDGVSFKAET